MTLRPGRLVSFRALLTTIVALSGLLLACGDAAVEPAPAPVVETVAVPTLPDCTAPLNITQVFDPLLDPGWYTYAFAGRSILFAVPEGLPLRVGGTVIDEPEPDAPPFFGLILKQYPLGSGWIGINLYSAEVYRVSAPPALAPHFAVLAGSVRFGATCRY